MLRAEHLHLSVPGKVLCQDLSVTLAAGSRWGIMGRNGSGKTTLLHALSGLTGPAGGAVYYADRALAGLPRREAARRIGVLLQDDMHEFWGTALEWVLLGRFPHQRGMQGVSAEDQAAAHLALHQVGMEQSAQQPVGTLSGGERQRVRIAMLLAQNPDVYCLDEPLQHLDLRHQAEVIDIFHALSREQGKTVLMVLHEPLWASRFCEYMLLLYEEGEVASGPAQQLLTLPNMQRLYQCSLDEVDTAGGKLFLPRRST